MIVLCITVLLNLIFILDTTKKYNREKYSQIETDDRNTRKTSEFGHDKKSGKMLAQF